MPVETLIRPPIAEDRRHHERRGCPVEQAARGATIDVDTLRAMCGGEDPWTIVERSAGRVERQDGASAAVSQ